MFVDAIHTDVNFIGTRNRVAHVDFYPNDGNQVQAGADANINLWQIADEFNLLPGCPPFRFNSYKNIVNSESVHTLSVIDP